ncbi:helix-turn-helix domain-containing protein [Ruegeria atlantica]|uniref:Transcriptional regulator EutR n=1 Tax=Ruegeria atlantica TaxID=81569 RepID=A0A0P1E788_9RHOB|nr:helix-turn-helix domain-containing protein [Ruegeria atlantica]CUH44690.1 transcriptional regulator EutR [Ruegeria atlantica]
MNHIENSPNLPRSEPLVVMTLPEPNDINRFSPWEIDFRQIEAGAMETKVTLRAGSIVTLLNISMSRAVHQTGVSPKGLLTFGVIRRNDVQVWQGQGTSESELLSFGCSDPFDGVSATHFCGTTVSVKEHAVEFLADALGLNIPESLRTSAKPAIFGQHKRLAAIRRLSERLTGSYAPPMTDAIEEEIVAGLLLAANSYDQHEDKSTPLTRSRAVSKTTELMSALLGDNVPISRICREAGVSWRTLDRAFFEKFGVGPKKYYLRFRLNRVRSDLIRKTDQCSISDIANRWGFWHLGQFAQDYHNMFGELPSQTGAGQE